MTRKTLGYAAFLAAIGLSAIGQPLPSASIPNLTVHEVAPLFFFPHYSVTHAPMPGQYVVSAFSLVTDANGNAYYFSYEGRQAYLNKIDRDGRLIYHVVPVSGAFVDAAMTVPDLDGNAYVAASAPCDSWPVCAAPADFGTTGVFAVKLDPVGNVVYRFSFPITGILGFTVGHDGSTYFTGGSDRDGQLKTTPGAWVSSDKATPGFNPFVIKLNPAGNQIVYTTFLDNGPPQNTSSGGAQYLSAGYSIAVDALGSAYVAGTTEDPRFPVTPGSFQTQCGCQGTDSGRSPMSNVFVMKLTPDGTGLSYATFLAAPSKGLYYPDATPRTIEVDSAGNAEVTMAARRPAKIIVRQLNPDGTRLLSDASAVLSSATLGFTVPNSDGRVLVTGTVDTNGGFPLTDGALQNGSTFVSIVRSTDGAVLYSTSLPYGAGSGGVASDGNGGFIVLGVYPSFTLTRFVPGTQGQAAILGVANIAESNLSPKIAPGEVVGIYGMNLGPAQQVLATFDGSGHLPFALAGTDVYFDGVAAPILSVGSQQVNAIVPFGVTGPTAAVTLRVNGVASNTIDLPQGDAEPQIIHPDSDPYDALALNEDGTINSPQNPAKLGSIMTVFINGGGLMTPTPEDGTAGRIGQKPTLPVSGYVFAHKQGLPNGGLEMIYAGAAPGEIAGLLQVNFRLPLPGFQLQGQTTMVINIGAEQTSSNISVIQ